MVNKLIDGKKLADEIYNEVKIRAEQLHPKPRLAIVLASNDESSHKYVELKMNKAKKLGIETKLYFFDESYSADQISHEIKRMRSNDAINGILLQLPLYEQLWESTNRIIDSISSDKDADGLTPYQQGRSLFLMPGSILPATVEAVLECINYCFEDDLRWENIQGKYIQALAGNNCLIVNDSNMIGRPLAMLLNSLGGTVTIANRNTKDLSIFTKTADLIVSATGKTNLIDSTMVKDGAILIDVTSTNVNGKVLGDFIMDDEMINKAKFYTPVPGGVGPLTIACLLRNLVR